MTDTGSEYVDPERAKQPESVKLRIAGMTFDLREQIDTKLYWMGYSVTGFIIYYSKDLYNIVHEITEAWGLPARCEIDNKLPYNTLRAGAVVE